MESFLLKNMYHTKKTEQRGLQHIGSIDSCMFGTPKLQKTYLNRCALMKSSWIQTCSTRSPSGDKTNEANGRRSKVERPQTHSQTLFQHTKSHHKQLSRSLQKQFRRNPNKSRILKHHLKALLKTPRLPGHGSLLWKWRSAMFLSTKTCRASVATAVSTIPFS